MADDLADFRKEFQWCQDYMSENHKTALDDINFSLLGKQWPESVVAQREAAHRPMLTINKHPAFIRQVVNDARQNKPSIEVRPVDNLADPVVAQIYAGVIRNIEAVSNADVAYDTSAEQAVASGFGYLRIKLGYAFDDSYDLDILIDRIINQFSVYPDPSSTAADSSDWDICYVTDRLTKKQFERKYAGKANVDWDSTAWSDVSGSWMTDDGVLIAERWQREDVERPSVFLEDGRVFDGEEFAKNEDLQRAKFAGTIEIRGERTVLSKKVTQTIMNGCEVLEEEKPFPSKYIPIVPTFGSEVLVQGRRFWRSLVHDAQDPQRQFNYWRTAATELVALAPRVPFIGPVGFAATDPNWDTANTDNHAYLEYDVVPGASPPQRQPLDTGAAAGALQEALNASDDMKSVTGLHDASLGARSNETSGKAIMARQREGDVSTFHFQDNQSRAIRHCGRILVDMIPRVYSGPRMLRILGEDGQAKNVQVNKPYEVKGEDGQPVMQEGADEQGNPIMEAMVAMHDLATGKYDVVVKAGPNFTSRREEAAYSLTEALRSAPMAAPVLIPEILKMSDFPGAQEIGEKIEAFMNPQADSLPPEVQEAIEQGQAQIEQLTAENEALKAKLADKSAQIQVNAMKAENDAKSNAAKNETDRFNADTNRMEAEIEVAGAQQRKAVGLPIN